MAVEKSYVHVGAESRANDKGRSIITAQLDFGPNSSTPRNDAAMPSGKMRGRCREDSFEHGDNNEHGIHKA
jgi:hypothetical protein